jgi:hypothetical protein
LERTVQELNAALVASRNSRKNNNNSSNSNSNRHSGYAGGGPGSGNVETNRSIDGRIDALEMDLENANAQLALEKERVRDKY